ncbi:hypothetical protein ACLOJK_029041 [Asimina triloba]
MLPTRSSGFEEAAAAVADGFLLLPSRERRRPEMKGLGSPAMNREDVDHRSSIIGLGCSCYCQDDEDVVDGGWELPNLEGLVAAIDLSGLDLRIGRRRRAGCRLRRRRWSTISGAPVLR